MASATEAMKMILQAYSNKVSTKDEIVIGLEDGVLMLSADPQKSNHVIIKVEEMNERLPYTIKEVTGI